MSVGIEEEVASVGDVIHINASLIKLNLFLRE